MRQFRHLVLLILLFLIGLSAGMLDSRTVLASYVLATIKSGQAAEFDNCIIVGDLDLSGLKIEQPVHFNHTLFQDHANFRDTIFNGNAYLVGSEFNGTADFGGSEFNDYVVFIGSEFNDHVNFGDSEFSGTADFEGSEFSGTADFVGSEFSGAANFRGSEFNGIANFEGSEFNGTADFWGSEFNGAPVFMYSEFNGTADFGGSEFNDYVVFMGSEFNDYANFGDSEFNGTTYFWGSEFNGRAYFDYGTFNKEVSFNDVMFKGNTSFNSSQFKGDALFENATIQGTLSLTRARYDKLFIRWHSIEGGLVYDDAAYMTLMKNFKDLGYLEDYDSCYVQYRKEHRAQPWPAVSGWEAFIRKTIDYPMEWFYGYGKKPFNAFIFSLAVVLVYAFFWWALGVGGPKDKTLASLPLGEEWLDGDLTDILGFSVTVFLSGTRFFIEPPALPKIEGRSRSLIKKAFILERLLGALFSILFFIAIGGTIVRTA